MPWIGHLLSLFSCYLLLFYLVTLISQIKVRHRSTDLQNFYTKTKFKWFSARPIEFQSKTWYLASRKLLRPDKNIGRASKVNIVNKIKHGPYISSHESWQNRMEWFGKTLTQIAHLQLLQVTYIDRSHSPKIRLNNIACHIEAWSFIPYKILCELCTWNPSLLIYWL